MKHPVVYIKGKGGLATRFSGLIPERMHTVSDISGALRVLTPLGADHAFILYEQRDTDTDCRNIRFLRSWFPGAGIILIARYRLADEERRAYLRAGVNSAAAGDIPREDLLRTMRFMADHSFVHKPVVQTPENDVQLFRMPLWKRTFDIAASLAGLIVLSPLLLVVAAAVKIDSPGPVLYKSKRVGSNYRIFDFLKFRSMRTDADQRLKELGERNQYASEPVDADSGKMSFEEGDMEALLQEMEGGVLFADDFAIEEEAHLQQVETEQENAFVKIENDPRVTRLGRVLRKYSIDELPQLLNILRGDMSVVGNRPLPLYEAERLTSDEYIERFMCPSGLTGLWQVEKRGGKGKLSPEQRKQLDIRYAREMSFWFDLKILLRTFTAFVQKENV